MSTMRVEVSDLAGRFEEIITLASEGSEVILTDKQIPVAMLVPLAQPRVRVLGLHAVAMTTTDDFDKPLQEEFWAP